MTLTDEQRAALVEGTAEDVMARVGEDLEKVEAAIEAERGGRQRSTLLTKLELLRAKLAEQSGSPSADPLQREAVSELSALSAAERAELEELRALKERMRAAGPVPDGQDMRPASGREGDQGMCAEHFPMGWESPVITRTEKALGRKQPQVTCEHGTYGRPADS